MGEIFNARKEVKVVRTARCVMRRDEVYVGKRVTRMDVEGRRRKGRPKRRWMDSVKCGLGT